MDMFRNVVTSPAATATPSPTIPVTPVTPATTSGVTAPAATSPITDAANVSPLDNFTTLWEPDAKPKLETPADRFANVDPQKIMEAASGADFTKAITPETLNAIRAGGDGAMEAMLQAMNKMTQTVYAQSAIAANKIVSQALREASERSDADLPGKIKQQTVSDTLRTDNPALSHPAAAPILQAIEFQMSQKFPNASAAELTTLAKDYLVNFANLVSPKPSTIATPVKKSEDWDSFLL